MVQNIKTITETTLIPLSLLGVIVAASFWFAGVQAKGQSTAEHVESLQKSQDGYSEKFEQIIRDQAVMKSQLEDIRVELKRIKK